MAVRVVTVRVGEVDLLVEMVLVAGTEQTSALDKVGERIVDAFAATAHDSAGCHGSAAHR